MSQIIVRAAPSPTGKLHIGNVRTFLFGFLFARANGGKSLLRVEDTDKERSTEENIGYIHDALNWLQIEIDDEPVLQSKNEATHRAAVQQLLETGKAYEDDGAIRFRVAAEDITFTDLVQGEIHTPHDSPSMKDFVIQRSDGTPTYNLAVVCDDHAMGITHVLRGADHINNTPKQILLYQAFGWDLPQFGHLPMILGEDGEKLSKRHGAVSIQDLRAEGYLPLAVQNQLMRLGWAPDTEDVIDLTTAAKQFDLTKVAKSPAVFSYDRLNHYNSQVLREQPEAVLDTAQLPTLERIKTTAPDLIERINSKSDLTDLIKFISEKPAQDETTKPILTEGNSVLQLLSSELTALPDWNAELLGQTVKDFVKAGGYKFPQVGKPLRAALIGQLNGPDNASIMAVLGKDETLTRLQQS